MKRKNCGKLSCVRLTANEDFDSVTIKTLAGTLCLII